MKNKELYQQTLRIAFPMMIQSGITNMVGLVDNVMVGSLGTEAMTGVAIVGQLIFVNNLAIFGGLAGPSIYGAQFYGNKDIEGVRKAFRFKLWFGMFCVLAALFVFLLFGGNLIRLYLQGESAALDSQQTFQYGMQYMHIMLLSFIPFALTQIYASSLRETAETFKPMVAGVVSVFVDIVLNYLLIFGKFGCPQLGVKGAAIATVVARLVELSIVVIWSHIRRNQHVFLQGIYKTIKVPKELTIQIIKKGSPIFFNEFLWSVSIAVLTQCYSLRGLNVVPSLNISNTICNLMNISFIALGNAVGIIIGQYLGASEFKKARTSAFSLMRFTAIVSAAFALMLIAISGVFPKFYDTTAEIRKLSTIFIITTSVFFPVQGYLNAIYFTLRSGGKTFITFLFDSGFSLVVCVPVALVLTRLTTLSIVPVYAIVMSLDIIKTVIGYVLIRKGVWIANLVDK